jgi:tetratricopeptide (TPR) repeat protein
MSKIASILLIILLVAKQSIAQNKYEDSLQGVIEKINDPMQRFTFLNKLGQSIFEKGVGNVDSLVCIQMISIAKELNNDSLLSISYNWIGDYFFSDKGDITTALEYLFKAIPYAEKANDKRQISSIYLDIAVPYLSINNPDAAIPYIRKAGENLPDSASPLFDFMARQYQSTMANYFLLKHQPDSALSFVQDLKETNLRKKSIVYDAIANALAGQVYDQKGETELASIHYIKANALVDSGTYHDSKLFVKRKFIPFLLRNKNWDAARLLANQLLALGKQINNHEMQLTGADFLEQIFSAKNVTDSAYYYSRMQAHLKEVILNQDNINKIQALAFKEQLRNLDASVSEAKMVAERKQNLQYALIGIGIVILITSFLMLSRSFITNTKMIEFLGVVILLIVFEFLNLLLHPFLERITHHSPALVLLGLVCIAAMLVPAHHKLEKWATTKLVEKNKKVRLALAKKTLEELEGDVSAT